MGLGSGMRKKPIPDPGSRGQKGTGSRIRIRNTGCFVRDDDACANIVDRVADPNFSIPDPGSRVKKIPDPGSESASKNFGIFNSKNCF
jgi:hypothetical protein